MATHQMVAAPKQSKSLWDMIVGLFVDEEAEAQKAAMEAQMKRAGYKKETVGDRINQLVTGTQPTSQIGAWIKNDTTPTTKSTTTTNEGGNKVINNPQGSGTSGGVGVGGSSPVEELKNYTADELAKRFGIVNDYATILKEMQDATTAQFDETETTMKRAESTNLRAQESAYNQYLQDLRSRSANAVASGATKGTMAANALTSLLGFQESNRESTNLMNDLLYDTAQQRGKSLKADVTAARQQATEIGQYLGNLSTSMDTNAINKYAAELAAEAQTRAASIGAGATTSAARMSANSAYEQILNAFYNDYLNKGYSSQQADALKYTDYADIIKKQYNPTK